MTGQHDVRAYIADMSLARKRKSNLRTLRTEGRGTRQTPLDRFVAATRAFGYLLTLVLQLPPDCHCAAHQAYLLLRRSKPGLGKVDEVSQGV